MVKPEPGAERPQQAAALLAHCFGHREDDLVAPGRPDPGEADAGIAAGRLDDGRAGGEDPFLLGILDHRQRDAVLDASAGIEELQFDKNVGLLAFDAADFEERGFPDESGK